MCRKRNKKQIQENNKWKHLKLRDKIEVFIQQAQQILNNVN